MLQEENESNMLMEIIKEINKALADNMYIAALSMALTIPDICGKAEYPNEKVGKRYIDWFEENIGKYEHPPFEDGKTKMPYLSGEVVYSLRNSMLHQGTPNIDKDKIKEETNKIDRFILVRQEKNEFDIYSDSAEYSDQDMSLDKHGVYRSYYVNIRRLCMIICATAEGYYKENKEKFDFFNYVMVDKGHEYDDIFSF